MELICHQGLEKSKVLPFPPQVLFSPRYTSYTTYTHLSSLGSCDSSVTKLIECTQLESVAIAHSLGGMIASNDSADRPSEVIISTHEVKASKVKKDKPKRSLITAACEECRLKKAKVKSL